MSAGAAIHAAVKTALRAAPGLAEASIFAAPPLRAAHPFVVVTEPLLTDWGCKGADGREARIGVAIEDSGEEPVRLRRLAGAADAALATLPRDLGDGWRIASAVPLRVRIVPAGTARWTALVEWRLRVMRLD